MASEAEDGARVAASLKLVFPSTDALTPDMARWFNQGILFAPAAPNAAPVTQRPWSKFAPAPTTPPLAVPHVLSQTSGGPCGLLASLQAELVSYFLFDETTKGSAEDSLIRACYEICRRAAKDSHVVRVAARAGAEEPKPEEVLKTGRGIRFEQFPVGEEAAAAASTKLYARLRELLADEWRRPAGCVCFLLSVLESRGGATLVRRDMDDETGHLTGLFGHAAQELLNLIVTGKASSQVHDGALDVGGGLSLRGVTERPRVGFLTQLESLRYCAVGSYLKNPEFPVWILGSQSHFTVLAAADRAADFKSERQQVKERAERAFKSGGSPLGATEERHESGFLPLDKLGSVLQAAGVMDAVTSTNLTMTLGGMCETRGGAMGIVLWDAFWEICGPGLVKAEAPVTVGKLISHVPAKYKLAPTPVSWACPACTFVNSPVKTPSCQMCGGAKPAAIPVAAPPPAAAGAKPWNCKACTLLNPGGSTHCEACGTAGASDLEVEANPSRSILLYHVDGLSRSIQGVKHGPAVTRVVLTTVEADLAAPSTHGDGDAFEEALHTKWPGGLFEYPDTGKPPSIVG